MIGDKLIGVQTRWYAYHRRGDTAEWTGLARHSVCDIEHVGVGWILIRRPKAGVLLKKLSPRIDARRAPGGDNLLLKWIADDEEARQKRHRRIADPEHAEHAEAMLTEADAWRMGFCSDEECPYTISELIDSWRQGRREAITYQYQTARQ